MENIGALAVLLAFCFAIYAVIASVVGKLAKKPLLALSAERAVYSVWGLLTTAAGLLVYSLIHGDYRMAYVYETSNRDMPTIYKFSAWWGGQEGSLLLWSWLLSTYSAVVVVSEPAQVPRHDALCGRGADDHRNLLPDSDHVRGEPVQGLVGWAKESPTSGDGQRSQSAAPILDHGDPPAHVVSRLRGIRGAVRLRHGIADYQAAGRGLDQHYPPLDAGHLDVPDHGRLAGAGWAYAVLGWGGYWAWDPVENASLLPWITATAFLHSVMMQEKKGMMKVWNMVLVSATFWLCIFGTSLTRTGAVQSVHAFAQSPLGPYFKYFLLGGIALTTYLILNRLQYLKSEAQLESVLSRESSFMFNNLILLASCFAILWGTLFPVISEAVMGEKISVDKPFFDSVNIPIGLFLLLLTGVGPLIAWRKSSLESLRRAFLAPLLVGVVVAVGLFAAGVHHLYALISFLLCAFVLATVAMEFYKGASAIRAKSGTNLISGMVELTHRNTRRYGGYIVHVGIVLMFVGFTGAAFNQDTKEELGPGESLQVGRYAMKLLEIKSDARTRTTARLDIGIAGRQERSGSGHAGAGAALLHCLQPADFRGFHPP